MDNKNQKPLSTADLWQIHWANVAGGMNAYTEAGVAPPA